ncbi:DHA2 family efflux MFS transporter permease subunit [Lolliginicoccus levis]|uniref:DHA2 family efflux MFS transporter permease subunit n=1 Tax=Lolliginicoccus levis TaxID=2919542 RepID=UPI00241ED472|nr:DHA2 family efflux MFS transporter permease subunit [Lolliginicoccus levis]
MPKNHPESPATTVPVPDGAPAVPAHGEVLPAPGLPAPAVPAAAAARPRKTPPVLHWLVAATFIVILNETIMMNALPVLMDVFQVTERTVQWLSTAFMLTMAVVIPATGWFLQRVTTRAAFVSAMSVFLAGTAIAAAAPIFEILLLGRIVQAVGTAVMLPLLMTTLMTVVPEHDRGRVMGNVMLAISVAPAMGPAVSGLLLAVGSWRLIFIVVLPIVAAIIIAGLRYLMNVGENESGPLDQLSVILAALGFGITVYGLSEIGADDPSLHPAITIIVGLLGIALFAGRQIQLQRTGAPLLDLRTLTHRTYALALGLLAFGFMAMMGAMVLFPLFLQNARDLSALQTGLLMMPGGLAMGLLGPTVGRMFDKHGGRLLIVPGAIGILVGLAIFARMSLTMPLGVVLAAHILLMVSLAAVFTPVFTIGLSAVPPHLYSHGSSLLATLQQVAAAMGAAILITVMAARARVLESAGASDLEALVGGMQWAFGVGALLGIAILAFAVFMPHRPDGFGEDEPGVGEPGVGDSAAAGQH